jgi:hypothetical protein
VLAFVAVNISSRLFASASCTGRWPMLHDTGLDPALLELEVTESAVMEDPEVALEQLHRLRELGVTLAIDDFRHRLFLAAALKRLPVQKLKIDQGFVAELAFDDDDIAIVRVIIALARSMGMQGARRRHRAGRAGALPAGAGSASWGRVLVRAAGAGGGAALGLRSFAGQARSRDRTVGAGCSMGSALVQPLARRSPPS